MGEPTDFRWDVFLAHPSSAKPRAEILAALLEKLGVSVCLDQAILRPGDDWHQLLPMYQRQSRVTVALITTDTADAHYENAELVRAILQVRSTGHRLIPVHLEPGLDPPYGTEQLQALDWFVPDAVSPIAEAIRNVVLNDEIVAVSLSGRIVSPHLPVVTPGFCGRDEIVGALVKTQRAAKRDLVTQVLVGLGGVGKSTIAAAVLSHRIDDVDVVWWVPSEDASGLVAGLAELASNLGLKTQRVDEPSVELATRALNWLEETTCNWLLVFDNADDVRLIERWLPRRGHGAIMVTTRRQDFAGLGPPTPVHVLSAESAQDLLRRQVETRNPEAAADAAAIATVANRLGRLPLALRQAGAFVARSQLRDFSKFLDRLNSSDPLAFAELPLDYDQSALEVFSICLDAAEEEAQGARACMRYLSILDPDEIPVCLITKFLPDISDVFEEALVALEAYSLITISGHSLSVHRMVQAASDLQPGSEDWSRTGLAWFLDRLRFLHELSMVNPDADEIKELELPDARSSLSKHALKVLLEHRDRFEWHADAGFLIASRLLLWDRTQREDLTRAARDLLERYSQSASPVSRAYCRASIGIAEGGEEAVVALQAATEELDREPLPSLERHLDDDGDRTFGDRHVQAARYFCGIHLSIALFNVDEEVSARAVAAGLVDDMEADLEWFAEQTLEDQQFRTTRMAIAYAMIDRSDAYEALLRDEASRAACGYWGVELLTQGDFGLAAWIFSLLSKLEPEAALHRLMLGQCLQWEGQPADAYVSYTTSIHLAESDGSSQDIRAEALLARGDLAFRMGQIDEARNDLEMSLHGEWLDTDRADSVRTFLESYGVTDADVMDG